MNILYLHQYRVQEVYKFQEVYGNHLKSSCRTHNFPLLSTDDPRVTSPKEVLRFAEEDRLECLKQFLSEEDKEPFTSISLQIFS